MQSNELTLIEAAINRLPKDHPAARVTSVGGQSVTAALEATRLRIGDRATIRAKSGPLAGEVIRLDAQGVTILVEEAATGVSVGDLIVFSQPPVFAPHKGWIGRVIDPDGHPLDGRPILPGLDGVNIASTPPPAHLRRAMGDRLGTGMAIFNTLLPIVRGQRMGLFAGSGVGKSTLIGNLARGLEADVIVVALVGERGRELRHFVEEVLGPDGMRKTVVVAATSDRAAPVRLRCAASAMSVAEYFRDQGLQVCLFIDSVTRFCEAHREVALSQGEDAKLRGFPASTAAAIARLCERAGPGIDQTGDITAVFSVLVAGSDMEEPVADMLRGVLDGHIVLDRQVAERGRFPAVDVVRSVSRALPAAASPQENDMIGKARKLLATYEQAALMIQSGLYEAGADPTIDQAISCFENLEDFIQLNDGRDFLGHFARLRQAVSTSGMRQDSRL